MGLAQSELKSFKFALGWSVSVEKPRFPSIETIQQTIQLCVEGRRITWFVYHS